MLSVDQINNLEAENERLNKELETAVTQYNAVVAQNKDLQKELNHYKKVQNKKIDLIIAVSLNVNMCAHLNKIKSIFLFCTFL